LLVAIVERVPNYRPARFLLGRAYLMGNRPQLALVHFEELRKQFPRDAMVQFHLAQAYSRVGKAREALVLLDGVAKPLENIAAFHLERSRALLAVGRPDDALKAASAAQALAPQTAQPYLVMGQIRAQ
jgi:predicted Zn-dependent protease